MLIAIISLLVITIFANIILGIIILAPHQRRSYVVYFVIVLATVVLWALGDILMLMGRTKPLVYIGAELFYIAPMLTPVMLLFFSKKFPIDESVKQKYVILGLLAFAICALPILININFIINPIEITNTLNIINPRLPGFIFYGIYLATFFILVYIELLKKMRHFNGIYKLQVNYVYFGVTVSSGLAMFTNIVLPVLGQGQYIWLGPPFTLINTITMFMAMYRYQLFEFKTVILRVLSYTFFVATIAFFYVSIISLFSIGFSRRTVLFGREYLLSIVATLIVALTFGKIRAAIDKSTNKIFYRDAYDPQVVLNELNASLVSSSHIEDLLSNANGTINRHIRPVFNGIIIDGDEKDFKDTFVSEGLALDSNYIESVSSAIVSLPNRTFVTDQLDSNDSKLKNLLKSKQVALVAKLTTKNELVGLIILGERKSGNSYSTKDIQLIETAADSISIAAQNALRYEEIKKFNITLEHKIEAATHQLQKTNEKLKALDEAKDEFISMASHQLRTPLTSVKGYISMVLEGDAGKINDLQRRFLNQSFISSQRMVYLISDLLNVSRLKTGKFIIDNKPTYLPDTVSEEIMQLEETVKARELTMKFNKPVAFPSVNIDEEKIRQVIMNFADNAIYYTPAGGTITIDLMATKDTIEYTVKDNGIGVPRSEHHHLFTKFYRAGNARKARPDGTGLGLFMAKKVIIAQGGAIIFHSQEGKGSTFGFSLPRHKVEIT